MSTQSHNNRAGKNVFLSACVQKGMSVLERVYGAHNNRYQPARVRRRPWGSLTPCKMALMRKQPSERGWPCRWNRERGGSQIQVVNPTCNAHILAWHLYLLADTKNLRNLEGLRAHLYVNSSSTCTALKNRLCARRRKKHATKRVIRACEHARYHKRYGVLAHTSSSRPRGNSRPRGWR